MGVRIDLGDMNSFIAKGKREVKEYLDKKGRECVQDAYVSGSYKDQTGRLRASNRHEASEDGLVIENTAEYASNVEHKGYEVLSGPFLRILGSLEK